MSDLIADLKEYTDDYGLVHPNRNPGPNNWSGNGLLFTAEAIVTLYACRSGLTAEQRDTFTQAYENCEKYFPGLMTRHPVAFLQDQEGPDDYIGCGCASFFLGSDLAARILSYGRSNSWVMNNIDPGRFTWASWMGRFPALICHLEFAAGERPSLFKRISWALTVAFQPWKSEDDPILSWLMILTRAGRSRICGFGVARFYQRLKKKYPGGMKDVFTLYFGSEHPLSRYSWTIPSPLLEKAPTPET